MITIQTLIRGFWSFFLLLGLTTALRAQEVVFIANPQGTDSSLTSDEIKAILLGNKVKWNSAGIIQLAVLTRGPAHEKVMSDFVQRSADQFDKYWKKQVFTGKGVMPRQFADEADLVTFVAATPGALGYAGTSPKTDAVKIIELK